jgi:hypothetical protein
MGDYVLESNPALERLIERLGEQGKPSPSEDGSSSNDYSTRFRWRRRPIAPAADHRGIPRGNLSAAGANDPAERATAAVPTAVAKEVVFEDNLWAIHNEPQAAEEMVLVDFDEEPEVFAEDLRDHGEDENDAYEADEILEIYELEELHDYDETAYEHDELPVEVVDVENEGGDWILDAFKAWMLETAEAH